MRTVLLVLVLVGVACSSTPVADPFANSFRGYAPINNRGASQVFYWFFESSSTAANVPIILYLEGGPGIPGLFSVFYGPTPRFAVTPSGRPAVSIFAFLRA